MHHLQKGNIQVINNISNKFITFNLPPSDFKGSVIDLLTLDRQSFDRTTSRLRGHVSGSYCACRLVNFLGISISDDEHYRWSV